ncbi:MAG: hypothetical protein OHK0019_00450 [Saprospiraceae bacterium]
MSVKKFDTKSPGFLYSAIVAILTLFAASGVQFPSDPATLGNEYVTTLSNSGIYALVGVLVTSFVFPVYNFVRAGGKFTLNAIFSKTSTWIALGVAASAALALTGFVLPDGTVEQIVSAVYTKDWMSLVSVIALTVGNTLIRYLKQQAANTGA